MFDNKDVQEVLPYFIYNNLLYKSGQDFLDTQHLLYVQEVVSHFI